MEEEAPDMDTKQRPFSSKIITVVACVLLVPLAMASLLAWTILGRLCRLGSRTIFVVLLALVLIPPLVEPGPFAWGLKYTFDTSLLDSVCVLLATYAVYVCALLWSHEISPAVADTRRIATLPVAIGAASFFLVKLSILSRTDDIARWKVAWLWVCFLWSVIVYVSMSRWWTDSSIPRLAIAEKTLMNEYAQVEFDQSVVAGLGTVTVRDPSASGWGPTSQETGPSKPVLVLVHGYAAGNAFWMFVLKGLSQHFRVACVEMFGCGRSERLPFKAKDVVETERLLVECLEKWRAEMGIEEMVLCGHSLGGMAVAAYAMEHPHRLKMLYLASPAGVGGISMDGDGGSRGSLAYKVYSFLWNRGFGPLGIVRWSGPFGRRMARMLIARRLSWVPETAKIREVDSGLLGDYIFQLLALPASGEKIIFPLLNPDLRAYRPLLETLRGSGGGGRAVEKRGVSCPVSIIYGEPGIDWMPTRHGVDLVERLKNEGIRSRVYTVSEAGHTDVRSRGEPSNFPRWVGLFDAHVLREQTICQRKSRYFCARLPPWGASPSLAFSNGPMDYKARFHLRRVRSKRNIEA